jgi:small subunit ribosomal protein S9
MVLAESIARATGRRKTSVARVRLVPGTGNLTVNGKSAVDYFHREVLVMELTSPMVETQTRERYDVVAICHGGGKRGQAGAVCRASRGRSLSPIPNFAALRRTGF